MKRLTVQLVMAILLVVSGIVLLFSGFWVAPAGEISTFAGALFGVDYSYKIKQVKDEKEH